MFASNPSYTKLKTNLRLAINRLKLLGKKKSELAQKSRKEIAEYIANGKIERAKIRVECIIREDYLVEAMELLEMYCDLLVARFGLLTQMKELDEGLAESVSSILWVAPRLQADVPEMKIISDLLTHKYGKQYAEACRSDSIATISDKLRHKMSVQSPPKLLVEKYLIEIAKNYSIPYEPDPEVMKGERGVDALLDIGERNDTNNLGGGGGGMPQPPGFIGFPQPPLLPVNSGMGGGYTPFNYPNPSPSNSGGFVVPHSKPSTPSAPKVPYGAPLSYNIPPGAETKDLNTNFMLDFDDDIPPPSYDSVSPDENQQNINKNVPYGKPKPQPRSKMPPPSDYPELPELPNVPSDNLSTNKEDDIDFDDLARRFEELKKKK
ncbi:IST1 homolog [Chrysoperla carnea]|uniref:IST1 homolog n=1 Tax=Chrysoperla carnea TaxID=189513 RepID=UPI001D0906D5|nr:IST1 homolog [Chrysoperla carnea]